MRNLLFFLVGLAATLLVGLAAVRPLQLARTRTAAIPTAAYAAMTRDPSTARRPETPMRTDTSNGYPGSDRSGATP